jgi:tetratricopeptide (TPR) repeat protein
LAGIALAIPMGLVSGSLPDAELVTIVALSAVLAAFALRGWVREGRLSASLLAAAAGALLLNLLAAGGIGFPGVALSLWLLLALCHTAAEGFSPPLERGRAWRTAAVVEALLLAVACYFTAYRPTLTAQGLLARAEAEPREARELLRQAVDADPWGSEAPGRLAAVEFEVWRHNPAEDWRTFAATAEVALARNPYSSSLWFRIGEMYAEANRLRPDEEFARQAVEHFRRAAELYPTLPLAHARLSQAWRAAGDEAAAAESAAEALRLHDLTHHAEKKLPPELLEELGRRP